jgi:hypothetical protein
MGNITMRTALLTTAALTAIALWGLAVYTDGAIAGHVPVDGYGVSVAATD